MFKKFILVLVLAIGLLALMGGSAQAQFCPACYEGVKVSMADPSGMTDSVYTVLALNQFSLFDNTYENDILTQGKSVLLRNVTDKAGVGLLGRLQSMQFVNS